jgi:SPP1 family predicted phage head-tail adaptor
LSNFLAVGPLRQRVTIQVNTPTTDTYGQTVDVWTDEAERWARIEPNVGAPYVQADQLRNLSSHRITLRFYSGLTPRHRVLFGDRVFNITGCINVDERKIVTTALCQEVL